LSATILASILFKDTGYTGRRGAARVVVVGALRWDDGLIKDEERVIAVERATGASESEAAMKDKSPAGTAARLHGLADGANRAK